MNLQRLTNLITTLKSLSWKWPAIAGLVLLLIGSTGAILLAPEAPFPQIDQARLAISSARRALAERYATKEMAEAEYRWQQTQAALHEVHQQWFLLRDFAPINLAAIRTTRLATLAANRALACRDSLGMVTVATMIAAKQKLAEFESAFEDIPLPRANRGRLMHGALLLAQSEAAFAREDLLNAAALATAALQSVSSTTVQTTEIFQNYLADTKKWRQWVQETIAYSDSQNCVAIIVDKMEHQCRVYRDGLLSAQYPVELGPRWLGQKNRQGDNATPEGCYMIIKKKEGDDTIYHKALEINYPNDDDRARIARAKLTGRLPATAPLGGLIEIHGEGGKGSDWTAGCMALRNEHMNLVYAVADSGTPVAIVGSMNGIHKRQQNKLANLKMAN